MTTYKNVDEALIGSGIRTTSDLVLYFYKAEGLTKHTFEIEW